MNPTQNTAAAEVTATPAGLLRSAADYITTYGWTQHGLFQPAGLPVGTNLTPPATISGALCHAACSIPVSSDAMDAVVGILVGAVETLGRYVDDPPPWDHLPNYRDIVTDWNDEPDRTAAEVIAVLRAAADRWDAQHTASDRSGALVGSEPR